VRATEELARWISTQIELAELGRQRTRVMEAELRALRAQISPHFIYNCLAAIASFVRTDPDRARELLLEFADFTRYAFRRGGAYTTLRDELQNIERYLALEKARFGDRLLVQLTIAPEVLSVSVPFLAIQPLVENAVRHGIEGKAGDRSCDHHAADVGAHAEITIEDDGSGSDPDTIRAVLAGESGRDSVGLGNVDARLRQAYGDEYGLVVETAPGAGTRVSFRVPKFAPRRPAALTSAHAGPAAPILSGMTTAPAPTPHPAAAGAARRRRGADAVRAGLPAGQDERIGQIHTASAAPRPSRPGHHPIDVIFTDISMPDLDGLALARVLARFADRPQVVFVTAYDEHAVAAFELEATDYVMKPVRAERLSEAVRRVVAQRADPPASSSPRSPDPRRRDHPGRARRRDDLRPTQPDPLRPGAGRLRAAAHRQGLAPRADLAQRPRRALG
jgi:CheY-like chemotaxis protein